MQSLRATLRAYAHEHRWVVTQRLRLTALEKQTLLASLATNVSEENRFYEYDYYRDNCVTRVRDHLDRVTNGALSAISHVPAERSWRQHTSRATGQAPLLRFLLNATLTSPTDRAIDAWDEMFLPEKFHEWVGRATVRDGDTTRPLVEHEEVLLDDTTWGPLPATHGPPPAPSARLPLPLWLGACVGSLLAILGYWGSRAHRWATALLALCSSAVGLATGVLGALFVFLWVATRHTFAHHNENLLQLSPVGLAMPVLAVLAAVGRPRAARWMRLLVLGCLSASSLGLLLKLAPPCTQHNGDVIALCLPIWLGAALGWWRLAPGLGHSATCSVATAPAPEASSDTALLEQEGNHA